MLQNLTSGSAPEPRCRFRVERLLWWGEGGLESRCGGVGGRWLTVPLQPGGGVVFPFHQDVRDSHVIDPLQSYVQTYLLVDQAKTAPHGRDAMGFLACPCMSVSASVYTL